VTEYPTGTVTFVFTDVVSSTQLWDQHHDAMRVAMEEHDAVTRRAVDAHRGVLIKQTGDGAFAVFGSVLDAVRAAASIQLAIDAHDWGPIPELAVRIGLHTGEAALRDHDYFGAAVNRASRVASLAGAGEILVSLATQDVARDALPNGFELRDLGERELRGFSRPEHVFELVVEPTDETSTPSEPVAVAARRDEELRRAAWIAVLPFDNIGNDPEQEYFADGITEDLMTALAAYRSLRLIARTTTSRYKASKASISEIAADLGVRFVLEGSVRKSGNQVRVTAQLIEAANLHHVWADRYDAELEDVFDLQVRIASSIAVAIDPAIRATAAETVHRARPENLDAWDHVQRGYWELWKYKPDANERARQHFTTAVELDPEYGEAHAGLSFTHMLAAWLRWEGNPKRSLDIAYRSAKAATAVDARDAMAHLARAMADYGLGRLDSTVKAAERAIELNPSLAEAHMIGGAARSHGGDPEGGIRMLERAVALAPHAPMANWFYGALAISYFIAHDLEHALAEAHKAIALRYGYLYARVVLVASLAELGRLDEAHDELVTILEINPAFNSSFIDLYTFNDETHQHRLIAGLRAAGLEG